MRSEKAVKRRHVRCPHRRHHRFRAVKQQRSTTAHWKTNTYFDCKWKQPRVVQEIQVRVPKQTSKVKSNEHVSKPKKHVDNQATATVEKSQRAEKEQKRQQELELKKQKQKELEAEKRAAKERERKEKLAREESERAAKEEQLRQKQAQEEADRLAKEKKKQEKAAREKAQREAKEKEKRERLAQEAKESASARLKAQVDADEQAKLKEEEQLEKERVKSEEKSNHIEQDKKSQRKDQKTGKTGKQSTESHESAKKIEEVQTKTTIQQNGTVPNGIAQNGTQQNGTNEKATGKPAGDDLLLEVTQQNNKSVEAAMISSVDSGVEVAPETKNKNGLAVEEQIKTSSSVTPVRSIRQEIEAKQTEILAQITEFVTFAHSKLAKPQVVHSEQPRKPLNFTMPAPLPPRNIEIRKRERAHRLLPQDVDFCVYMIETYGDDFEGMSKDPKNRYKDDAKQISRKIRIFRNSVHYEEYLAEKNGTATTA
ncbi:hypothetical protein M3Y96_00778600 [Aphelenchoides besseyi]|nr:hypothetical protein M3Y96_00778600 [Aphelenchoides besseyi]